MVSLLHRIALRRLIQRLGVVQVLVPVTVVPAVCYIVVILTLMRSVCGSVT